MRGRGIYQILNRINGKRYIGSAVDLWKRESVHRSLLGRGIHGNRYLQNAWNKYGAESFSFEVLEYVINPEQLIEREQYYLDTLKPEYNLSPTAGSNQGITWSEETRKKISESLSGYEHSEESNRKRSKTLTGRKLTEETRLKMSEAAKRRWQDPKYRQRIVDANKGKKHTDQARQKMSEAAKGRTPWNKGARLGPLSEEHRRKLSEAGKGRKFTEEHRRKLREAALRRREREKQAR